MKYLNFLFLFKTKKNKLNISGVFEKLGMLGERVLEDVLGSGRQNDMHHGDRVQIAQINQIVDRVRQDALHGRVNRQRVGFVKVLAHDVRRAFAKELFKRGQLSYDSLKQPQFSTNHRMRDIQT